MKSGGRKDKVRLGFRAQNSSAYIARRGRIGMTGEKTKIYYQKEEGRGKS